MERKYSRGEKGQFNLKGEERREVRSLRLTDSAWEKLGEMAEERCITRADLIEEVLIQDDKNIAKVVGILQKALTLKANAGGAIKEQIRQVLDLL